MPITSTSTVEQIEAQYLDSVEYGSPPDQAKCRDFIGACRALIIRLPSTAVKGMNSLSYRLESLQRELERAQEWLEQRFPDDAPQYPTTVADFRRSRTTL